MELYTKKKYFSQQNALAFSSRQIKNRGPTFKIGLAKKLVAKFFVALRTRNKNATTGVTKNLG